MASSQDIPVNQTDCDWLYVYSTGECEPVDITFNAEQCVKDLQSAVKHFSEYYDLVRFAAQQLTTPSAYAESYRFCLFIGVEGILKRKSRRSLLILPLIEARLRDYPFSLDQMQRVGMPRLVHLGYLAANESIHEYFYSTEAGAHAPNLHVPDALVPFHARQTLSNLSIQAPSPRTTIVHDAIPSPVPVPPEPLFREMIPRAFATHDGDPKLSVVAVKFGDVTVAFVAER
ncbi:hypothetical protein R3P38DRAFT_3194802 [Favolaschia claudopus]|uniref:Uncharacterized protein n=1 Tax=Favolaschia claudopus TaxID=2862362 RepID=A0AAW0BEV8_9AGAR